MEKRAGNVSRCQCLSLQRYAILTPEGIMWHQQPKGEGIASAPHTSVTNPNWTPSNLLLLFNKIFSDIETFRMNGLCHEDELPQMSHKRACCGTAVGAMMPVMVWSLPSFNMSFMSVEYLFTSQQAWLFNIMARVHDGYCPGSPMSGTRWSLAALSNHHKKHYHSLFRNGQELAADLRQTSQCLQCIPFTSQRLVYHVGRLEKFHKVFMRSPHSTLLYSATSGFNQVSGPVPCDMTLLGLIKDAPLCLDVYFFDPYFLFLLEFTH